MEIKNVLHMHSTETNEALLLVSKMHYDILEKFKNSTVRESVGRQHLVLISTWSHKSSAAL